MLRWVPDDFKVVIASDMDQAGDQCAEKFYSQIPLEKLARLKLPCKDLNEWFQKDPFITKKDVVGTLTDIDHFFLEPTGFLKIDLKKEVSVKSKIVCRTGFDVLDDRLGGGLFEGQTTGLLGPSGQGKTTFVNQLGLAVAASQIPVGLISVEGSRDALAFKLKEAILNGFEESQFPEIERNMLVSQLSGHRIIEEELYRETLRLIESGARLVIIDNLDHIFRGDSQKKSDAYGMLIDYAIKNKVHIMVIWQPHKVDRDAWVNSGSQKGFSMSLQDADNYLSLNRTKEGICLDIEKNRQKGISKEESKIYFIWDQIKRLYVLENRFTNDVKKCKLLRLK
jgi:archaellum biogenesis ATPase FlaH